MSHDPDDVPAVRVVVAVVFVTWFRPLVVAGRRQRMENRGTWRRLVAHAFGFALAGTAPLLLVLALDAARAPVQASLGVAFFGGALGVGSAARFFRSFRVRGNTAPLPLVLDAALLARTAELAKALGIATPPVRRIDSFGLDAQAFAAGLHAPTLIVADGITTRLTTAERDGILAHELAHVSTGSLAWLALLGSLAGLGGTLGSTVLSAVGSMFLCLALYVALRCIVGRRFEVLCDLAGGRAVGYATMARALDKVHAVSIVAGEGWFARLVFATTTHPPRVARLAALARAGGPEDRAQIAVDARELWQNRVASALTFAAFVLSIAGAFAAERADLKPLAWALLTAVALAPTLVLVAAVRRESRVQKARLGRARGASGWVRLAGLVAWLASIYALEITARPILEGLPPREHVLVGSVGGLVAAAFCFAMATVTLVLNSRRAPKNTALRASIADAIRTRSFDAALVAARRVPGIVARDPILRHDVAVATALAGDPDAACAQLEALEREAPELPVTTITLGTVLLRLRAPERALAAALRAKARLPRDPGPRFLAGIALRRLGRLDEAQVEAEAAVALGPRHGTYRSVLAAVALDRGNIDEARRLSLDALRQAPGDPGTLIVCAEIALASGSPDASAAVDAADAAVKALPFVFADDEIVTLRAKLAALAPGAMPGG